MNRAARGSLVVAVLAAAAPATASPKSDACQTYAGKIAALMYGGFERGSHGMGAWVKPEFLAAVATPIAPWCTEHLPLEHARCVSAAATSAAADTCALDPAIAAEWHDRLTAIVKAAEDAMDVLAATDDECRTLSKIVRDAMAAAVAQRPEIKVPNAASIAAVCIHDRWTADFVRCTNAGHGAECKGKKNVGEGLRKLAQDAQIAPPAK